MIDNFDEIDRQILSELKKDGRKKFLDIARQLKLAGGTIHARIAKYRKIGILKGFRADFDLQKMGYSVTAFIGLSLSKSADYLETSERLKQIPEVLEIHYTTGDFSLFIKVTAKHIQDLHSILYERIQSLEDVEHTQSIISLDTPLLRQEPEPLFVQKRVPKENPIS